MSFETRSAGPFGRDGAGGEATLVTFLFTDVVGSTGLWERNPDGMRRALARHDELVAELVETSGGMVVKSRGEGDSVFAVFDTAASGLRAALDVQRALGSEPWPDGVELRVRMALHTGEAESRVSDYYGPTVNRCARLRALGHGGQVLLSEATAQAAANDMPEGVSLRDLGLRRLKDLSMPEQVFQLCHRDLRADFAPLVSVVNENVRLLESTTSFVGRDQALADLAILVRQHRLVTIVGPGGIGKTRLAVEVARAEQDRFAEGVWFVDLSPVTEDESLTLALASVLGVSGGSGGGLLDAIVERLGGMIVLLVLDNCEQVIAGCGRLASELLARLPDLRVLATSREDLGIYGEAVWAAAPLGVPGDDEVTDLGDPGAPAAVRLFVDRARLARPGIALGADDLKAVGSVCRRVDGLPLAIELAAARTATMTPAQIDARLSSSLGLLHSGPRDRSERQRTLTSLVGWSYDLLEEADRCLLRRLGVFAGPFDHAAAAAVGYEEAIDDFAVLERLERLVRRSLLVVEPGRTLPFRMLETIRKFARDRMAADGESQVVADRHAGHWLEVAEALDPRHYKPDAIDLARAATEDLREALAWYIGTEQADNALVMCWRLQYLWRMDDRLAEARYWHSRALSLAQPDTALYALVVNGRAEMAARAFDYQSALAEAQLSLDIATMLDDPWVACHAPDTLSNVLSNIGDKEGLAANADLLTRAAARTSEPYAARLAAAGQAEVARLSGDLSTAKDHIDQYFAAAEHLGDPFIIANAHVNRGEILYEMGRLHEAELEVQKAQDISRRFGIRTILVWAAWGAGVLAIERADHNSAVQNLTDALSLVADSAHMLNEILLPIAALAIICGDTTRGAALLSGAERLNPDCAFANWGGARLAVRAHQAAATPSADHGPANNATSDGHGDRASLIELAHAVLQSLSSEPNTTP